MRGRALASLVALSLLTGCGAKLAPTIGEIGGPELITGTEALIGPAVVKPPYVSFTSGGLTLDRAEWNSGLARRLSKTLKARGTDVMDGPPLTVSLIGFEHRVENLDGGGQQHTAQVEVEVKVGKYEKSHVGDATSTSPETAVSEAAAQALTKLLEDARFRLALTRP